MTYFFHPTISVINVTLLVTRLSEPFLKHFPLAISSSTILSAQFDHFSYNEGEVQALFQADY